MDKATDFYRARTVVRQLDAERDEATTLEQLQSSPAYVLLGEPGSGKTQAFLREAEATGGHYVRARNFSLLTKEQLAGRAVFIDGLDERRAVGGSGHTPLDNIREHLAALGRPSFRLSCREADWLGDSDREALEFTAPGGSVEVLRLEPLSDKDVIAILEHEGIADPKAFFKKAQARQLDDALRNPNTLKLLAKAVGGDGAWPKSKAQIFERACSTLARETNREHLTAAPGPQIPIDYLLEAAGYLSSTLLLSGVEGFRAVDNGEHESVALSELVPMELPLKQALQTSLFVGPASTGRGPLHRSVAEYLAGKFIAKQVDVGGLPVERIIAACTGSDGGVAPDLRGLVAWLSAFSTTARLAFIRRDPLGVVLYGDVSNFTPHEKELVFAAFKAEAERYPAFRSEDWTTEPFGALATRNMLPVIEGYLRPSAATSGEQAFQDCVIDAVANGDPMPELEPLLEAIARSDAYWTSLRWAAMEAIEHIHPGSGNCLMPILEDIRSGKLEDRDDELVGHLLHHLYKRGSVGPREVFNYFWPPKQENLIGNYRQFWNPDLSKLAAEGDLPILLDELAKRRKDLEDHRDDYIVRSLAGDLLIRTLEVHGDSASDEQLWDWLNAGRDKYGHVRLDHDDRAKVGEWIGGRPDRYRMLAERPVEDCRKSADVEKCLRLVDSRHFDAKEPQGMAEWYLAKAAMDPNEHISEHYYYRAVFSLMRRDSPWPSDASLDLLGAWDAKHPKFLEWHAAATSTPVDAWQREEAAREKKRKAEEAPQRKEFRDRFGKYLHQIVDGTAPHGAMYELARVHDGRIIQGRGDDPQARLRDFFGEEGEELVQAALAGLPRVPERPDLPTVDEIIKVDLEKKHHYIREAALVGMEVRYARDAASAFTVPDGNLEKLCAFWLTKGGEERDWYLALAKAQPQAVAAALVPYAQRSIKAKKEHVAGIWQLGHEKDVQGLAMLAIPPLLEKFPLRCQTSQLERCLVPMLKGALAYLPAEQFKAMVAAKLKCKGLDMPQRVYWLAAGLLVDPGHYLKPLVAFVKDSAAKRGRLADFLDSTIPQSMPSIDGLPDAAIIALVELLGPEAPSEFMRGSRQRISSDNLGQLVRVLIQSLEKRGSANTLAALERLLEIPNLTPWSNFIRASMNSIRVSMRRASIAPLTAREASELVSNSEPANAGDLAAIAVAHLREIARKIRDGATNDYRQYWNHKPPAPKREEDCRDALQSQLEERFARPGFSVYKEPHVADDKRADIMARYAGAKTFAIPIEAKREGYSSKGETVWTALRTQLIDRYSRFPEAHGHGIYVVFWFGGKELPPSPSGKKPKTPVDLEEQLRALLAPDERRIQIVVIDCSLPSDIILK